MDTPSSNSQRDDIRVSDAERDQAVAELSEHYQAGRLTLEEFDDRSSSALRARTGLDLKALFTDLPRRSAPLASPPVTLPERPGPRPGGPVVARTIIAFVIAAIVIGNVAGNAADHQHSFGWLVPVVILLFVFLRLMRRRR